MFKKIKKFFSTDNSKSGELSDSEKELLKFRFWLFFTKEEQPDIQTLGIYSLDFDLNNGNNLVITVYLEKPSFLIGCGGGTMDQLIKFIEKGVDYSVDIYIVEYSIWRFPYFKEKYKQFKQDLK